MTIPSITKLFPFSKNGIRILDVGAAFNEGASYRHLVENHAAHVWAADANPEALRQIHPDRREQYTLLPHVIGRGGPATLYFTGLPHLTSIYPPNPEVICRFQGLSDDQGGLKGFNVTHEEKVETRRLDDLLSTPIDYIKVDVQGAELDALTGASKLLAGVLVIESEVEFIDLYAGQPLYHDIAAYLSKHGFILHKLLDIHGRPLRPMKFDPLGAVTYSQVLWADAVFIRRSLVVDPTSLNADVLHRAAVILHDLYGSYDLVLTLLKALDRKRDGTRVRKYLNFLRRTKLPRRYFNLFDHRD